MSHTLEVSNKGIYFHLAYLRLKIHPKLKEPMKIGATGGLCSLALNPAPWGVSSNFLVCFNLFLKQDSQASLSTEQLFHIFEAFYRVFLLKNHPSPNRTGSSVAKNHFIRQSTADCWFTSAWPWDCASDVFLTWPWSKTARQPKASAAGPAALQPNCLDPSRPGRQCHVETCRLTGQNPAVETWGSAHQLQILLNTFSPAPNPSTMNTTIWWL